MELFSAVGRDERRLTAVVDIGKTHSRLLLLRPDGTLVDETARASRSVDTDAGYRALDTEGTAVWLFDALAAMGKREIDLEHIIFVTHGAALAALSGDRLAFPVPDYEWSGFDQRPSSFNSEIDAFERTLSPVLPNGLNLGVQLDWLERHQQAFADADTLMPYAQYWAWLLSDVRSSEVSSLGCHTLLWDPRRGVFSDWACRRGWDQRFAPMRKAWEVLGCLRPELAARFGLPRRLQVHVGAHDSNACLARYVRSWPHMTLVSTGTWVVVMTPGSVPWALEPRFEQLGNVSVRGEWVPTGRFLGGREFARLCAGADPAQAALGLLPGLLARGVRVLPGAEAQGGPVACQAGWIEENGRVLAMEEWCMRFSPAERATMAAFYIALMTAWTIAKLDATGPVALEGPCAHNEVVKTALACLMPETELYVSADPIEGSARGAWCLTRWTAPMSIDPQVAPIAIDLALAEPIQTERAHWEGLVREIQLGHPR